MRELKLKVGELIIEFRAADGFAGFKYPQDHQPFITSEGSPRCVVNVHYGRIPNIKLGTPVFQSGGLWSLHKRDAKYIVPLVSPVWGPSPYRLATFDESFRTGDLYISSAPSADGTLIQGTFDGGGFVLDPLAYPLDEVLVVNLLALEGGINIHACGVDLGGRGLAFCGTSGTGKSTTARIWKKRNVRILSDDRLILRKREGGFWVYGTPWHGEAALSYAGGVPLERIYFLAQAPANAARPLSRADAASRLLVHSFPTFYDSEGMEVTLRTIGEVCRTVPIYELGFVPNETVLDYLDGLHRLPSTAAARA